jgi:hypothetical protein
VDVFGKHSPQQTICSVLRQLGPFTLNTSTCVGMLRQVQTKAMGNHRQERRDLRHGSRNLCSVASTGNRSKAMV